MIEEDGTTHAGKNFQSLIKNFINGNNSNNLCFKETLVTLKLEM